MIITDIYYAEKPKWEITNTIIFMELICYDIITGYRFLILQMNCSLIELDKYLAAGLNFKKN